MSTVEARLLELETIRAYDSEETNDIRAKLSDVEGKLKSEKNLSEKLSNELNQMKLENKNVAEELVDIETKLVRDNLLFFISTRRALLITGNQKTVVQKLKCFEKKISAFLTPTPELRLIERIALEKLHPVLKAHCREIELVT